MQINPEALDWDCQPGRGRDVTNERSDELRRKHGHWSPHRDHHPVGSIADAGLDVIECLDALDAMTAECDRLRDELDAAKTGKGGAAT